MDDNISPVRIANSICQDKSFEGSYVLVEGKKDVKIYRRFTSEDKVKVRAAFGKHKLREVYGILTSRGFHKKIGIRDADFLRIAGNLKYSENYSESIFATDGHDAEIMMVIAGAVRNYFFIIGDEEKLAAFESRHGKPVVDMIFSLIQPLGNLRLANKRFSLGLAFKPERPEGNLLKIEKFVCNKNWVHADYEQMINTVYEYSKNRGGVVSSREIILGRLVETIAENHNFNEICNGHDFSYVLHMISKNGIGSKSKLLQDPACVQDLIISQFDWLTFSKTNMFAKIQDWQKVSQTVIFEAK